MYKKVLLIIDIQNDFCTGGSLEVKNGEQIITGINNIMSKFDYVVASQDWHPKNHSSFKSQSEQGIWPDHCVQGSYGAEFHKDLDTNPIQFIIRKGYHQEIDSYSAFLENDKKTETLLRNLFDNKNTEIYICGLALDYCVRFTAEDSQNFGYKTYIISDLVKSIGQQDKIIEELSQNLKFIKSNKIFNQFLQYENEGYFILWSRFVISLYEIKRCKIDIRKIFN